MATIKDIARLSGYSIGTVSRVINKHADVSEAAREKIEEIIRQLNYQPNANAKFLKQTSATPITLLIKGTQNVFLEDLVEKIQNHLEKRDEDVHVVFLDESADAVSTAALIEKERHPKGFVFLGGSRANFRSQFGQISTPSVAVSLYAADLNFDLLSSFATDDYAGSYKAAGILHSFGHRNIGVLGGYMSVGENGKIISRRLAGTVDCLKDNGISFDPYRQFEPCRFSMEDGCRAANDLLDRFPEVTAIYTHSDMIAIGALRALKDRGLRVPEDISLMGFDGIEITRFTVPRIATVQQDTDVMAVKAIDDLIFRIACGGPATHEIIPFKIIEKESIGPAAER